MAALLLASHAALAGPAVASNAIQTENALPGTTLWLAPEAPAPSIEGYTSEVSAQPGDAVHFHVSTQPAARYRILVYRLGWYGGSGARLVACLPGCGTDRPGAAQPVPPPNPLTGEVRAGWPVTDTLAVPQTWVSGYYVAQLWLTSGALAGQTTLVPFVVRPPATQRSAILVQVPVNTWQAYNAWGGKSLYGFNSTLGLPANHVSFDRPYMNNGTPGTQWLSLWELPLLRFLEREGYDVSYQTEVDTHRDPASLLRHRLVMTAGHGEYWTKQMRDTFDAARDVGTNLAFLGANTGYWQVRYENGERTVVGYKSSADPIPDPALKTVLFRDLIPRRWECELLGVQHQGGNAETDAGSKAYGVNPAVAQDVWLAKTGLTPSTVLPGILGAEWDSIPLDLPAPCFKPGLKVLFQGRLADAQAVRYVAPSGARIFSAGSLQFSWGLDDFATRRLGMPRYADPGLQQFMRNALDDLTRPARPQFVRTALTDGQVQVHVGLRSDPRVRSVVVLRHAGAQTFAPGDPSAVHVCVTSTDTCVDSDAPGHTVYRYEAVALDEWGSSAPAETTQAVLPDNQPAVQLRGPTSAVAERLETYVATVADRDGDTPLIHWTLDGMALPSTGTTLVLRFGRTGQRTLGVEVDDGHGGTARATLAVTVRGS